MTGNMLFKAKYLTVALIAGGFVFIIILAQTIGSRNFRYANSAVRRGLAEVYSQRWNADKNHEANGMITQETWTYLLLSNNMIRYFPSFICSSNLFVSSSPVRE